MEIKDLVSLNEIRRSLPGGVALGTITRWAMRGVLDQFRVRVFLQTVKIRGVRYTTETALRDFLVATGQRVAKTAESKGPQGIVQPDPDETELKNAGLL